MFGQNLGYGIGHTHYPVFAKALLPPGANTPQLSHNILHPAHGNPVAIPSQDMVLGFYYMTRSKKGVLGEGSNFQVWLPRDGPQEPASES